MCSWGFYSYFLRVLFNLTPPPELEGPVKVFNEGIEASVYLVPLLKMTELICAIAFISGRFVSLASIVLVPVTVNVFLYHAFVAQDGLAVGVFLLADAIFFIVFQLKESSDFING